MNRSAQTLPWLCEFEGKILSGLKYVSCWDRLPSEWTKYPEHYDYNEWYNSKIMRHGNVERKYKTVCNGIDKLLKKHGYEHQGNIYKDDFMEVWNNKYQPYRDREWMRKGECADCEFFRYCKGNGMHLRDGKGDLLFCHYKRLQTL